MRFPNECRRQFEKLYPTRLLMRRREFADFGEPTSAKSGGEYFDSGVQGNWALWLAAWQACEAVSSTSDSASAQESK